MAIGKTFQQLEKRFSAKFDELTSTWVILDLWHPSLENLDPEDDLAEDSAAMMHLHEEALLALLNEANRIGRLKRYLPTVQIPMEADKVSQRELTTEPSRDPQVDLKKYVANALLRLAISGDIAEIDR